MKATPRRVRPSLGPVVISVAAGVVVLLGGLFVNGCRISRLLSPRAPGEGNGIIVVIPSVVRDSAIAGAPTPRVTDLAVSNGGAWSATTDDPWIRVTPTSGGSRATVRMSLDPRHLDEGMHRGSVSVKEAGEDGASASVAVNFLIQQPVLKVEPDDDIDFRARTSADVFFDTLHVTNEGTGPLVWTATTEDHRGWLRLVGDTTGTAPGVIAIRATNEGLSYFGTFKETIIVSSPGAKNSPKRIDVTIRRRRGGGDDDDN